MIDPISGKTLFAYWRKEYSLSDDAIYSIQESDPTFATQMGPKGRTFLAYFVLKGEKNIVDSFLEEINDKKINLSTTDKWYVTAFEDDDSFKDEDFINLKPKIQTEIYRIANIYGCKKVVSRLNVLKMENSSLAVSSCFPLIAPNMNLIQVEENIKEWFHTLRDRKLLLTETEFNDSYQLDSDKSLDNKKTIVQFKLTTILATYKEGII